VDHGENTIPKDMFQKNKIDGKVGGIHLDILNAIMMKQFPDKFKKTNPQSPSQEPHKESQVSPSSPPLNI